MGSVRRAESIYQGERIIYSNDMYPSHHRTAIILVTASDLELVARPASHQHRREECMNVRYLGKGTTNSSSDGSEYVRDRRENINHIKDNDVDKTLSLVSWPPPPM
jgi:hypothetical protein